jgi:hypothetical protein
MTVNILFDNCYHPIYDKDIQNNNFDSCFVWVRNAVSSFQEHKLQVLGPRPKTVKVHEKFMALYNKQLHDIHMSPSIIWIMKSRI